MISSADDNTYAVEIGVDAEEEELGVVGGRCITWNRSTMYVYLLADGCNAVGISVAPLGVPLDPDIGRARARRNAINQVLRLRERRPARKVAA